MIEARVRVERGSRLPEVNHFTGNNTLYATLELELWIRMYTILYQTLELPV